MKRHRGWAGALLLVVQLVALAVVPLLHVDAPFHGAGHVEAPGSHQAPHDGAACHVCRAGDTRFAPTSLAQLSAGTAEPSARRPAGRAAATAPRPLYLPHAPRGPPAA